MGSGGDIFSFKRYFEDNFETVVRFAMCYVDSRQEAQDIAQETFIRLYENRSALRSPDAIRSYMYTTARNLCISRLRHHEVEAEFVRTEQEREREEDDELTFLKEATYQETLRLLHRAIDSLPRQSRQIILLGLDGKSNTEIATLMGISLNTVKTLKKSAYKHLRHSLGNLPEDYLLILLCVAASAWHG